MSIVRVSSELEVPIPPGILAKLGTRPGQEIMITERDGAIVLTPVPPDPVAYLCGVLEGQPSLTRDLVTERTEELESE